MSNNKTNSIGCFTLISVTFVLRTNLAVRLKISGILFPISVAFVLKVALVARLRRSDILFPIYVLLNH